MIHYHRKFIQKAVSDEIPIVLELFICLKSDPNFVMIYLKAEKWKESQSTEVPNNWG